MIDKPPALSSENKIFLTFFLVFGHMSPEELTFSIIQRTVFSYVFTMYEYDIYFYLGHLLY